MDQKKARVVPTGLQAERRSSIVFSFEHFDRTNKYFNLAGDKKGELVPDHWFLDLLDSLKSMSNMTVPEARCSMHDLHPVDWNKANVAAPQVSEQLDEYWQFRIDKANGRVVGAMVDNMFYIVWLDRYHNLTDSAHYPTAKGRPYPKSTYEELLDLIKKQQEELAIYQELFDKG